MRPFTFDSTTIMFNVRENDRILKNLVVYMTHPNTKISRVYAIYKDENSLYETLFYNSNDREAYFAPPFDQNCPDLRELGKLHSKTKPFDLYDSIYVEGRMGQWSPLSPSGQRKNISFTVGYKGERFREVFKNEVCFEYYKSPNEAVHFAQAYFGSLKSNAMLVNICENYIFMGAEVYLAYNQSPVRCYVRETVGEYETSYDILFNNDIDNRLKENLKNGPKTVLNKKVNIIYDHKSFINYQEAVNTQNNTKPYFEYI